MKEDIQKDNEFERGSYEYNHNLTGLFKLLLKIDKRINPQLYEVDKNKVINKEINEENLC
ncbi:MAG: hypothetical protein WCX74_02605 [Candidatus Paceibacterota bacterium]